MHLTFKIAPTPGDHSQRHMQKCTHNAFNKKNTERNIIIATMTIMTDKRNSKQT